MGKLSKVEACLLCEEMPCTCSGKKKKTQVVVEASPRQPEMRSSKPPARDLMKAAAANVSTGELPVEKPQQPSPASDNAVLATAIRALAPILHPEELERYSVLLTSETTATDRAAQWRARVVS